MILKTAFITSILFSAILQLYAQNNAEEYRLPEVTEGSNLYLFSYPNLNSYKENNDTAESITRYSIDFNSHYSKWKFTPQTGYLISIRAGGGLDRGPGIISRYGDFHVIGAAENLRTVFSLSSETGGNFYIGNTNFFAGIYFNGIFTASNGNKPFSRARLFPNIGYGKVVDAYVVNEASNIERILSNSSLLVKKMDNKTRTGLNSLLDKRISEYSARYKDNADIEFFSAIEKFLLQEGVIAKPFNARTTMKLYQLLTNSKFIYYPLLKGWHVMGELGFNYNSNKRDTSQYPVELTLSSLYGIPLSNKTSVLLSSAFSIPLNEYNSGDLEFNIHAPVFLRSVRNLNGLAATQYYYFNYSYLDILDYMISAKGFLFHNFSPLFGVSGELTFALGKVKNSDFLHQKTEASITLLYSVLSRMGIETGLHFSNSNTYLYGLNFSSRIYYYIF